MVIPNPVDGRVPPAPVLHSASRSFTDAMPVEVVGPAAVAGQVGTWVEANLGWQVTDGGHLPAMARLVVVDPATAPPAVHDLPTVVLIGPDDPPQVAARWALSAGAALSWPAERERLEATVVAAQHNGRAPATDVVEPAAPKGQPATVAGTRPRPGDVRSGDSPDPGAHGAAQRRTTPVTIRVGAASGGVGATTVALALGAWQVWSGRVPRCLVVASGPVPVPDVPVVDPAVVAGHRAWAAGVAVPGVDGLHVVATDAVREHVLSGRPAVTVVDRGVVDTGRDDVDILVARRDRAGLQAVTVAGCAAVVLVDVGPVPVARFHEAVGTRLVRVGWSTRVARANASMRGPAGLPGRWLQPLAGLVA